MMMRIMLTALVSAMLFICGCSNEDMGTLKKKNLDLQKEIEKLNTENGILLRNLEDERQKSDDAQKKIARLQDTINSLQEEVLAFREKIAQMSSDNATDNGSNDGGNTAVVDNSNDTNSDANTGTAAVVNPHVVMKTSMGEIVIELNMEKAPITVKNFLEYTNNKYYDGLIFHRIIDGFMIQGGGFDQSLSQKKNLSPIRNEASNGLKNKRGTIAMARTGDPHSATSQFFINVKDNGAILDYGSANPDGYAVFGKVVKGMDVVDAIKAVKTTTKQGTHISGASMPLKDIPVDNIVIESVRVIK